MRPLLFLDVDGVINCLGFGGHGMADRVLVESDDGSFPVFIPPGVAERIALLAESFDIVWATAWRGAAHPSFRRPLSLPEESWPALDWADLKLPHIVRYAKDLPWAWIDDDAEFELERLHEAFRSLPNSLIVQPDPAIGLTDEHVMSLLAFALDCEPDA